MKLAAATDRIFGRLRVDVVEGTVDCPLRVGRLDVEACSSCPYLNRSELDERGHRVVICRPRTLVGGYAAGTPPM
ncbi:MAG TPA: hypothetical protein VFY84_16845 [Jiangellales bacterium]|nr:hypothetical protein [Jiangellales bacterium]